jgi:hypothetical protein
MECGEVICFNQVRIDVARKDGIISEPVVCQREIVGLGGVCRTDDGQENKQ